MPINELNGGPERLPKPVLSVDEVTAIRFLCRERKNVDVIYRGRTYWSDDNGQCYVSAWKEDEFVSGDPV